MSQSWPQFSLSTTVELIRGILQGLEALHSAGYMHRDVSGKNCLIMSLNPPQAMLCDYDKSTHKSTDIVITIDPISTLASEVYEDKPYNSKIDIWALSWLCGWILFPKYYREHTDYKRPSSKEWRIGLDQPLHNYAALGSSQQQLADLVDKMLTRFSEGRLTASQALKHSCMLNDKEINTRPRPKSAKTTNRTIRKPQQQVDSEQVNKNPIAESASKTSDNVQELKTVKGIEIEIEIEIDPTLVDRPLTPPPDEL